VWESRLAAGRTEKTPGALMGLQQFADASVKGIIASASLLDESLAVIR
jgi:hypothetical protein